MAISGINSRVFSRGVIGAVQQFLDPAFRFTGGLQEELQGALALPVEADPEQGRGLVDRIGHQADQVLGYHPIGTRQAGSQVGRHARGPFQGQGSLAAVQNQAFHDRLFEEGHRLAHITAQVVAEPTYRRAGVVAHEGQDLTGDRRAGVLLEDQARLAITRTADGDAHHLELAPEEVAREGELAGALTRFPAVDHPIGERDLPASQAQVCSNSRFAAKAAHVIGAHRLPPTLYKAGDVPVFSLVLD